MFQIEFPINVQIQTNTNCNALCTFCPYEKFSSKEKFQLMEWSLYNKIIDECVSFDVKKIFPFFMNEPLLNLDLDKYIDYAKEKNPSSLISIFTNGYFSTCKNY